MDEFNKIIKDIKSLKIQGATNIALNGLKAMQLKTPLLCITRGALTMCLLLMIVRFLYKNTFQNL